MAKYTGACRYCGQVGIAGSYASQEAADEATTRRCSCPQATREREICETIEKAEASIDKLFGWGAPDNGFTTLEPWLVEDLKQKAQAAARGHIRSASYVLANQETAQIKAAAEAVKVKRMRKVTAEL